MTKAQYYKFMIQYAALRSMLMDEETTDSILTVKQHIIRLRDSNDDTLSSYALNSVLCDLIDVVHMPIPWRGSERFDKFLRKYLLEVWKKEL